MLINLIKYDLKWIYKVVAVFYCLALFFSITTYCFSLAENSVLFSILCSISNGFAIAMVANGIINCIIRSWVRFRNNLYKDEAYLTHTLPVARNMHYLSKTLAAIICTFTSTAVSAVCIVICFYNNKSIIHYINNLVESTSDLLDLSAAGLITVLFFEIFLQLTFILLLGYNAVIMGHKSNKNKMVKSIIIGFALYLIFNAVSIGAVFTAGLFSSDIMNLIITNAELNLSMLKTFLISAIVLYFIYNIICYVMGKRMLKAGVDID